MPVTFTQNESTFFVSEDLYYAPSGSGEFVFARFEKRNKTTVQLKKAVSERTGVPLRTINHAGFKDRAARAQQWLSWPRQKQRRPIADGTDFRVLESSRHGHALKVGHVKSNRFELTFSGSPTRMMTDALGHGDIAFPNYFGRQRFGHGISDLTRPSEMLRKQGQSFMDTSRFQAFLFNAFFQVRRQSAGDRFLPGDLCLEAFRKKLFTLSDIPEPPPDFVDLSPTGPIYGYRMPYPGHDLESEFLKQQGLDREDFRVLGKRARGGRRPLYAGARDATLTVISDDRFCVAFSLPSGTYATVFLIHLFFPEKLANPVGEWPDFTEEVTLG